jgi:hypothetical protein
VSLEKFSFRQRKYLIVDGRWSGVGIILAKFSVHQEKSSIVNGIWSGIGEFGEVLNFDQLTYDIVDS